MPDQEPRPARPVVDNSGADMGTLVDLGMAEEQPQPPSDDPPPDDPPVDEPSPDDPPQEDPPESE